MPEKKGEGEKLLGLRYETIRHFDEIHIQAKSTISLYLNPRWIWLGILLVIFGILIIVLALSTFLSTLSVLGYFILGAGTTVILSSLLNFNLTKHARLIVLKDAVKNQCYSWLLGFNLEMRKSFKNTEDAKKRYFNDYCRYVQVLQIPKDRLSDTLTTVEEYVTLKSLLTNEFHKSRFFVAGVDAGALIFQHTDNIRPLLQKEDLEQENAQIHRVRELGLFNNPILDTSFVDTLESHIYNGRLGEAILLALSAEELYCDWVNNTLLN